MAITSAILSRGIAAFFLIAYGLDLIAMGMLMGIKDIRFPLLINILIYWCFGMGSSYLLGFTFRWRSIGLWLGLTIGMTLATVFFICRFYLSITELINSSDEEEEALDNSQSTDEAQIPVLK